MRFLIVICVVILISSCKNDLIYNENKPISAFGWDIEDTLTYNFDIDDIEAKYNLYLQIRHRDVYEFMNVYIQILTIMPSGEVKKDIISIPLSDELGNWMGKCSGDVCYHQMGLMRKIKFNQKGNYTLKVNHEMRLEKLKNLLDLGIRLEKTKKKVSIDEA